MSAYLQQLGCPTVPPCCRDSPRYGKPQTVVEVELDLTKNKKLNDAVNRGAHFDNFMLKSYGPGHLFVKLHAGILTVIATKCFDRYKCDLAHGYHRHPTICMKPKTGQENTDWTTIRRWLDQAEEDYLMGK